MDSNLSVVDGFNLRMGQIAADALLGLLGLGISAIVIAMSYAWLHVKRQRHRRTR